MQHEITTASGPLAVRTMKCPTRVITFAWGEKYVDTVLTLTLPALLAPGNLPYVASEVPCELVILTERRFFSKFNRHPAIARVRSICPVRFIKLDDLIVSKDKYGMTLTYALHRGFSDLGPAITECWQIFLNGDFILADGSLRTVIGHLSRGQRIVASPSYCTIAEEVTPELHKHLDAATSTLSISNRELARLVLQHRHTVIRGKTVNQTHFHMRYADQFYWSVDDTTLIGYQMPVAIIGLWPQRYLREPNSYWDFGLIWEYCPQADVCVIGDSDEFAMLELRDKGVAEDQIVPGPANKQEIAERMVTWVTPYQRHFLKFPLTLHDRDLPPNVGDARVKLRSFVDEVMSNAPPLPSHIKHSQWEYHWAGFQSARRLSSRIRLRAFGAALRVKRKAIEMCTPFARVVRDTYVRPALSRLGLEIVKSTTLSAIQKTAGEAILRAREATLKAEEATLKAEEATLKAEEKALKLEEVTLRARRATVNGGKATPRAREATLNAEEATLTAKEATLKAAKEAIRLKRQQRADWILIIELKEKIIDLSKIAAEYQLKLERSYDYQALTVKDQLRARMSDLEPEFLALYEQCRQYTMT